MDDEELIDTSNQEEDEFKGIEIEDEDDTHESLLEGPDDREDDRLGSDEPAPPDLQAQLEDARRQIDGLRQTLVTQQRQQPREDYDKREEQLLDQQRALTIEYQAMTEAGTLTTEKHNEVDKKARDIQKEIMSVNIQRELDKRGGNSADTAQNAHYERLYGDVKGNPRALSYAKAEHDRMVALGHPPNDDTIDKAMNAARVQFKMVKGTPTDRDRAQLMGTSGGGSRKRAPSNTVKFDKDMTVMANEMFLDYTGDVQKAKKMYAKEIILPARRAAAKSRGRRR